MRSEYRGFEIVDNGYGFVDVCQDGKFVRQVDDNAYTDKSARVIAEEWIESQTFVPHSAHNFGHVVEDFNRLANSSRHRQSGIQPLSQDDCLNLFTKEVWNDLGFTGKGEYLAAVSDEVGMIPDDISPEARELRVSQMASRFEAGLPIFENDELSTGSERLAALCEA